MTTIEYLTIEAEQPEEAARFYDAAFGLGDRIRTTGSEGPSTGFRGFTVSLMVQQPANVTELVTAAVAEGATVLKPATQSLFGFGGGVRAPDGTIWKIATAKKKDTRPASRDVDDIVVLLGTADAGASKRFSAARGVTVSKSFGGRYVEFDLAASPIKLALSARRALAKDAGVPEEGTGPHAVVLGGDIGHVTDPDGFRWDGAAA